mmetsp:Transcript_7814/g.26151  ORF Transcript_7814/g.26151 Transcript_7814/m.26151 type:complete len:249 (-) Transcript_7814:448-1194(-)
MWRWMWRRYERRGGRRRSGGRSHCQSPPPSSPSGSTKSTRVPVWKYLPPCAGGGSSMGAACCWRTPAAPSGGRWSPARCPRHGACHCGRMSPTSPRCSTLHGPRMRSSPTLLMPRWTGGRPGGLRALRASGGRTAGTRGWGGRDCLAASCPTVDWGFYVSRVSISSSTALPRPPPGIQDQRQLVYDRVAPGAVRLTGVGATDRGRGAGGLGSGRLRAGGPLTVREPHYERWLHARPRIVKGYNGRKRL